MQHITITVDSPVVHRQVTGRNDGKVYHLREQSALFHYPDGQVVRHGITIGDDQAEYPSGRYVLDIAASMYPGKYGPQLSRDLVLRKAEPAAAAKTGTNG